MRIALLCPDRGIALGGIKGASLHLRSLARELLAMGHRVSAIVAEPGDPQGSRDLVEQGLDVRSLRGAGRDARQERMRELDWHLAKVRPELLIERLGLMAPEGAELAAASGIPHLYEANAPLDIEAATYRGFAEIGAARAAFAVGFAASRGTVAVSDEVADWVRALAPASHRVLVLPNGAAPEFFAPPSTESQARLRRQWAFRPAEFRVGFVGSFRPWHDLDALLDSTSRLAARTPTRLVLVGDGPQRNELLARATALELPLTLAGHIPHADVPAALSLLDAVAVPYAVEEAYFSPLKLFEAMAAGRAIVASATRPVARVLRDRIDARLVSAGDREAFTEALAELAANPALRGVLGAEARRTAEVRHTWRGVCERLLAFAGSLARLEREPCRS